MQVSTYPGRQICRIRRTRVVFMHKSSLIYDSLPKFLQLSHFAAVKTCQGYITGVTEIAFHGHVIIFLMNPDMKELPRIGCILIYFFNWFQFFIQAIKRLNVSPLVFYLFYAICRHHTSLHSLSWQEKLQKSGWVLWEYSISMLEKPCVYDNA